MTKEELKACVPKISDTNLSLYIQPLNDSLNNFDINSNKRVACFIAQIAHESNNFNATIENLNYSANGLLKIFPKYFNQDNVDQYARRPEKIANKVYANRLGNGTELSEEGWKYRGRGIIQITGKDNYRELSIYFNVDFINTPELLEQPNHSCMAAGWFWNKRNLNKLADINTEESFKELTRRINGGFNGLEGRIANWKRCKTVLNVNK